MCIYFPPHHLCSVSVLWSEGQSALCCLLEGGERCPLGDGRQHLGGAAGRPQARVGAAQVEKAAAGGGDGCRDQDYSLSCVLPPKKTYFFQMLVTLVCVQLGRCTQWQIWLSVEQCFVWILKSPCVAIKPSLLPWFADTWPLCFIYCARSAACIPRPCTKEATLLLDCR